MNTIIELLLSLHARYPGVFLVLASAFKAATVFTLAWSMVLMLEHRSARARNWIWRLAMGMMLMLAVWIARPEPMQDSGFILTVVDRVEPEANTSVPEAAAPAAQLAFEAQNTPSLKSPENAKPDVLSPQLPKAPGWRSWMRRVDERLSQAWLLGFLALLTWKVGQGIAGRWWLARHSESASQTMKALCPEGLACRISHRVSSPLITGWFAPTVWLPTEASDWDELKLRAVFQHEHAHHRRHDAWWQALGTLAACAWWWLPLSWVAFRKLRAEAEHAADDVTVTQSLTAPDYAEALVQIARGAGLAPPAMRIGIAMSGYSQLETRVRALLRDNPWRDRLGFFAGAAMTLMMIGMSCVVLVGCKSKPQQYVSLAKLVAGGRMISSNAVGPQYQDYLQDYYGTIIETLESTQMRRLALERVRALNPDLKEADVDIKVTQNKGSAIFNVAAIGTEPKFTRVFLDSLLDEFRAFREQIREQQRNKALTALAEDVVKRESALREKGEKITIFKKNNNTVILMNGQNQSAEFLKQLMLEKNRLELQLSNNELAQKDLESSLLERTRFVDMRSIDSQHTDTGLSRGAAPGFSRLELDYFEAKRELTNAKVDIELLMESKTPDPAKLQEARDRVAKQEKLIFVYTHEITESLKGQKAAIGRQLAVLDLKIAEFSKTASDTGAKLAEFSRLEKDYEENEKAYKEMFDLVHRFTVNEEMQGDYVNIMERASTAVEDVRPWWSL